MVTIIWETWLNSGAETEGLRLTRQIWSDMKSFEGYLSHQLFVDQDTAGHLFVISQWRSRAEADRVKEQYAGSETVRLLTPLLARPRGRWVLSEDQATQSLTCRNPMQVAAITGHKTLQMLKRYTHLRAEDLVELIG